MEESQIIYAPIIIFAFKRIDTLRMTVDSLLRNPEAKFSDLYVYVDGPRPGRCEEDAVESVREFVRTIAGFASVSVTCAEKNMGLGANIISGVSCVIASYGKAIVLEDDLVVTSNFLAFMNQGLDRYQSHSEVFSICGYTNSVSRPAGYQWDSYACVRSSSWGWATWKDRWESVDWILEPFFECREKYLRFNIWGGSDCSKMLEDWHDGRNKSWAIRFCYSQFVQDKVSIFPMTSKVTNNGFDGQGTNCSGWSRFKCDIDSSGRTDFLWSENLAIDKRLLRQAKRYHSYRMRLLTKIINIFYAS